MVELLRTFEIYFMHGSCAVSPRGRGVLFLGDGGTGKSTSVYALAYYGWHYVADDMLLMYRDGANQVRLMPLIKGIQLHGTMTHYFPGLVLESMRLDGKGRVSAQAIGANQQLPHAMLDQAIVLEREGDAVQKSASRLSPLRYSALMVELIRQNPFIFLHPHLAARHLEFLAQACKQVEPYRLEMGRDLLDDPQALKRILERYERAHAVEHYF